MIWGVLMSDLHESIDELLELEVRPMTLVFYLWFISRYPEGAHLEAIALEFYKSTRTIKRYMAELWDLGLIKKKKVNFNGQKIKYIV